jgi:hypothetical protein
MGDFEMSIHIPRGNSDKIIKRIIKVLQEYQAAHPESRIDLYRQNSVSVRIRIIDPGFADRNKIDRNKTVWEYLGKLPEDTQSDISMLILITPEEERKSFANSEFEDPVPSNL